MTATEALAFFADQPAVCARLQPLVDVGLDYVRLGQPVPTLSGGEAQRLKLAGHLAAVRALGTRRKARSGAWCQRSDRGKLLIFDEPTTGLHFEDIARLVHAFGLLLRAGHSLLVIEHNLDVIRAADWVIDLGPEGGERGGELIAAGTPEDLMQRAAVAHRPRARAVRRPQPRRSRGRVRSPRPAYAPQPRPHLGRIGSSIVVRGAREHNLKNIDVEIPRDRFTVITGVSGSGKSTLAFDILFNEGQRRYLESLNAYARQFVQPAARPDRRCDPWHPADGGDRAARQPRRPQEHGRDPDRDLSFPAPDLRAAGHAVLPRLRGRDRAAERRSRSSRSCCATIAARRSSCWRR